jgi:hypothetical protein
MFIKFPDLFSQRTGTGRRRTSPIYHFFEIVKFNSAGDIGDVGDVHYRCFHGQRKTVTVKRKANSSQTGMSLN